MTTETAIPTVFQTEFVEVAEEGAAEEVGEGEAVDIQEVVLVISGTVGCIEVKSVRVPGGVDKKAAGLTEGGGIWVLVGVGS